MTHDPATDLGAPVTSRVVSSGRPVADGAAVVFEQQLEPVRKLAVMLPVSAEMLADAEMMRGLADRGLPAVAPSRPRRLARSSTCSPGCAASTAPPSGPVPASKTPGRCYARPRHHRRRRLVIDHDSATREEKP